MKVAVVGLGYWGPNIVRNLLAIDAATAIVVCDLDQEKVAATRRNHPSVAPASTFDDLIADDEIAAVVIATPVYTHADLATRAMRAGKHVLVEKPFATSTSDARRLVDLARNEGLLMMAGHTFLFSPPVTCVARMMRAGDLGVPLYAQGSRVNLGIHQADVSVLWDLLPHDLSILMSWVEQRPVRVATSGRSSIPGRPLDVAFVDIEFEGGFVANLHVSWLAPTKLRRMTLVCSKQMVVYEDTHPEEPVKIYNKGVDLPVPADYGQYRLMYRTGDVVSPRVDPAEPLRLELESFLARVTSGERPDEREERAVEIVRIIEGAELSARSGGTPIALGA